MSFFKILSSKFQSEVFIVDEAFSENENPSSLRHRCVHFYLHEFELDTCRRNTIQWGVVFLIGGLKQLTSRCSKTMNK